MLDDNSVNLNHFLTYRCVINRSTIHNNIISVIYCSDSAMHRVCRFQQALVDVPLQLNFATENSS